MVLFGVVWVGVLLEERVWGRVLGVEVMVYLDWGKLWGCDYIWLFGCLVVFVGVLLWVNVVVISLVVIGVFWFGWNGCWLGVLCCDCCGCGLFFWWFGLFFVVLDIGRCSCSCYWIGVVCVGGFVCLLDLFGVIWGWWWRCWLGVC